MGSIGSSEVQAFLFDIRDPRYEQNDITGCPAKYIPLLFFVIFCSTWESQNRNMEQWSGLPVQILAGGRPAPPIGGGDKGPMGEAVWRVICNKIRQCFK